ncbi:zinc transporter ZIP6-like isoform X2 [Hypanus sabinus]|uniref:zinc transporter ZIP6-like isoform X2 n=1 Tax=Hypanus sabinus TaxID=79690 RepID=UPI0028C4E6EA|nr:zinc transporter ZIP6-like isoform X2 [Hypanus sabinus]
MFPSTPQSVLALFGPRPHSTGVMAEGRTRALSFLSVCLVTLLWNKCSGLADHGPECPALGEHNHVEQPDPTSVAMDRHKATFEQKYYLHKLFSQYGENGTLTVEGLEKLLCNIGVGGIRTMVTNHEHVDHVAKKRTVLAEGTIRHHCCPSCRQIQLKIGLQTAPKEVGHLPKRVNLSQVEAQSGSGTRSHSVSSGGESGGEQRARPARSPPSAVSLPTEPSVPLQLNAQLGTTVRYPNNAVRQPPPKYSTHKVAKEVQKRNHLPEEHKDLKKEECLNADKLFLSHGMPPHATLSAEQFSYLCPALLDQIESKACIGREPRKLYSTYSIGAAWIGGFVSVTVISLLSLLGIIFMPLMNKTFVKFLLTFLVALAVGTLSGDAFLHLLPHSQGVHHHSAEHHEHTEEDHDHLNYVWKGLTALGGLYFMFLIEHLITLIKLYKGKRKQKKSNQDEQDVDVDRNVDPQESQQLSKEEPPSLKQIAEGDLDDSLVESKDQSNLPSLDYSQNSLTPEQEVMITHALPEGNYSTYVPRGCENKCHSHFHDTIGNADDSHHHHHHYHHILHHHHHQNHHPHSHGHYYLQEDLKDAGIATLAWMVIMGDGLHNFSDGLAIGAAFTGGLSSGLSTSVAVFCHELPHELGNFAVLLKAGMTIKQAILYNVLSASLGYLGMITGTAIGHYAENVSMWIFAITAGLFLYVALVDMVPEMLHSDAGDHDYSHGMYFLLQNAGILLGFGIMLLIAIFEHKILSDVRL